MILSPETGLYIFSVGAGWSGCNFKSFILEKLMTRFAFIEINKTGKWGFLIDDGIFYRCDSGDLSKFNPAPLIFWTGFCPTFISLR